MGCCWQIAIATILWYLCSPKKVEREGSFNRLTQYERVKLENTFFFVLTYEQKPSFCCLKTPAGPKYKSWYIQKSIDKFKLNANVENILFIDSVKTVVNEEKQQGIHQS